MLTMCGIIDDGKGSRNVKDICHRDLGRGDSTARMDTMNQETYLSSLHDSVMSKHGPLDKPSQIYNVDEQTFHSIYVHNQGDHYQRIGVVAL